MLAQMRELAPARGFGVLHDLPVIVLPGSIFPIWAAGAQGNVLAASGQVLVAAAMVELHLPPGLRSLHQAVGTALWICVVTLAALAAGTHGMTEIEQIVYESPSRGEFATPEGVAT